MATAEFSGLHIAVAGPCIPSSERFANTGVAVLGGKSKVGSCNKLASANHIASVQPLQRGLTSSYTKSDKIITKPMSESGENKPVSGLHIAMSGPCIPSSERFANTGVAVLGGKSKVGYIASVQPLQRGLTSSSIKSDKITT